MPVLFEEILFDLELKRAAALERAGSSAGSTDAALRSRRASRLARRRRGRRHADRGGAHAGRPHDARAGPGRRRRSSGPAGHRLARRRAGRGAPRARSRRRSARADDLRPLGDRRGGADRAAGVRSREGARPQPDREQRRAALDDRRGPAPHPALGPGRRVERREDRAGGAQGVHLQRPGLGAGRRDRDPRERAGADRRQLVHPDRARAGHRPGGARVLGQHAGRRALHRLPRRARAPARGIGARGPERLRADHGARGRWPRGRLDWRRPRRADPVRDDGPRPSARRRRDLVGAPALAARWDRPRRPRRG